MMNSRIGGSNPADEAALDPMTAPLASNDALRVVPASGPMARKNGPVASSSGHVQTAARVTVSPNQSKQSTTDNVSSSSFNGLTTGATTQGPLHDIATSSGISRGGRGSGRVFKGGRGAKGANFTVEDDASQLEIMVESPGSIGRGRGRGGGRPRGRGRGANRGRKRKREDGDQGDANDNDDDDDSDSSEVYTPTAVITKSGRSIQKPSTFMPPPPPVAPSPTSVVKKKRIWRRNPENAVCKTCLRGVSPSSNMIVFCDGCNTPYHRYCHHPPIDQSVVDEVDKEWYCRQCARERIVPVPEAEVAKFVAAPEASLEERQKYFSSLPPGVLVTLLTKATTIQPALPVFSPDYIPRAASFNNIPPNAQTFAQATEQKKGHTTAKDAGSRPAALIFSTPDSQAAVEVDEDEGYGPSEHPVHYPRPGQGLMRTLPPEQEDLHYLVDEESSKGVFHHIYQVDPQAANAGVTGSVASKT